MRQFTDQIGKKIQVTEKPKRIISLVPSQTELLFDLGLDNEVVGITNFCVHPKEWRVTKAKVGGTKTPNLDLIQELQPDLIIANKEENDKESIEYLSSKFPVWTSDISTFHHAIDMVERVGEITNTPHKAQPLKHHILEQFLSISKAKSAPKVLYLIWQKPFMSVGKDTFISEMLSVSGFQNCIQDDFRYPELTPEAIQNLNPDFIFLSSEPYPFKEKNRAEIQKQFPFSKVVLVDGEMFSWYGSRLKLFPKYLSTLRSNIDL